MKSPSRMKNKLVMKRRAGGTAEPQQQQHHADQASSPTATITAAAAAGQAPLDDSDQQQQNDEAIHQQHQHEVSSPRPPARIQQSAAPPPLSSPLSSSPPPLAGPQLSPARSPAAVAAAAAGVVRSRHHHQHPTASTSTTPVSPQPPLQQSPSSPSAGKILPSSPVFENFTADPWDFMSVSANVERQKRLVMRRENRGECRACGQKLFKVGFGVQRVFGRGIKGQKKRKKVPLTIDGKVLNGRCLNCFPIQLPQPSSSVDDRNRGAGEAATTAGAGAKARAAASARAIQQQRHDHDHEEENDDNEEEEERYLLFTRRPSESELSAITFDHTHFIHDTSSSNQFEQHHTEDTEGDDNYNDTTYEGHGIGNGGSDSDDDNVDNADVETIDIRQCYIEEDEEEEEQEEETENVEEEEEEIIKPPALVYSSSRHQFQYDQDQKLKQQLRSNLKRGGSGSSKSSSSTPKKYAGDQDEEEQPSVPPRRGSSSSSKLEQQQNSNNKTISWIPPVLHQTPPVIREEEDEEEEEEEEEENTEYEYEYDYNKSEESKHEIEAPATLEYESQMPRFWKEKDVDEDEDEDGEYEDAPTSYLQMKSISSSTTTRTTVAAAKAQQRKDDEVRMMEDVQTHVQTLRSIGDSGSVSNTHIRREEQATALNKLTTIFWDSLRLNTNTSTSTSTSPSSSSSSSSSADIAAKTLFVELHGIEALTAAIWADIEHPEPALGLLFALVTSADGEAGSDVLFPSCHVDDTDDNAGVVTATAAKQLQAVEGCIDALLIVMQTLERSETVQELGCKILCCLASATSNNANVNDGSLSGAVQTVLNTLDVHHQQRQGDPSSSLSPLVLDWATRALYQQCTLSRHAEANKRTLASSTVKSGKKGPDVLSAVLGSVQTDPILACRICKLYWCLSASEDIAEMLPPAGIGMKTIASIAYSFRKQKEYRRLLEASLATIANLSKIEGNCDAINPDDIIVLALDIMLLHRDSARIAAEVCCLVANLAGAACNPDRLIELGALKTILGSALSSCGDMYVVEEAMRAVISLCVVSDTAKHILFEAVAYSDLIKLRADFQDSANFQTAYCHLMASAFQSPDLRQGALLTDLLQSVSVAMRTHPQSEKVQHTACNALRVASSNESISCKAFQSGNACTSNVIDIMEYHKSSKGIQLNACSFLWNLSSRLTVQDNEHLDAQCIGAIVHAIQSHLETTAIVEMALGALWNLVHSSTVMKLRLVQFDGGMDAITCVLVMYPDSPLLLGKAIGILSSLTSDKAVAYEVITVERIDCVLDVIRNGVSAEIIIPALLFLRNAILIAPNHAVDANRAVPAVINIMKQHCEADTFQREAVGLLWVMASKSAEFKSKILALDGVTIIMEALEQSRSEEVQDVALGAFNELAHTQSTSV